MGGEGVQGDGGRVDGWEGERECSLFVPFPTWGYSMMMIRGLRSSIFGKSLQTAVKLERNHRVCCRTNQITQVK